MCVCAPNTLEDVCIFVFICAQCQLLCFTFGSVKERHSWKSKANSVCMCKYVSGRYSCMKMHVHLYMHMTMYVLGCATGSLEDRTWSVIFPDFF